MDFYCLAGSARSRAEGQDGVQCRCEPRASWPLKPEPGAVGAATADRALVRLSRTSARRGGATRQRGDPGPPPRRRHRRSLSGYTGPISRSCRPPLLRPQMHCALRDRQRLASCTRHRRPDRFPARTPGHRWRHGSLRKAVSWLTSSMPGRQWLRDLWSMAEVGVGGVACVSLAGKGNVDGRGAGAWAW